MKNSFILTHEPEKLSEIIHTQRQIIDHMEKTKYQNIYSIFIIVDDFADDPKFTRHSKILRALYTRGRHNCVSSITATQKFNAIAPIIRVNATDLYVYRLRNQKRLRQFPR